MGLNENIRYKWTIDWLELEELENVIGYNTYINNSL